jgi:peroxiredoxin
MRKSLLLLAMLVSISAMAQNEKPFELKGSFKKIAFPVQKILIYYQSNGNNVTDSVIPKDGKYSFSGKLSEPVLARVRVKYALGADSLPIKVVGGRDLFPVFLSADKITVSSVDSFSNVTVKGSKANDEYKKLVALQKPINDQLTAAYAEYSKATKAKDEAAAKVIEAKIDALDLDNKHIYADYAKANPLSPIALYVVNLSAGWDINPDEVGPLFAALPESARTSASGKNLSDRIEIARKTAVGKPAMDFTQNDTLGVPVSLASFKGKYVLVDFWASWCGPCRKENPNVVKAYNEFKDKNFSIISVSLDQPGAKNKWMDAIHKDNLTWTHVSDLKYWDNDVAKLYGIRAIPQNFLLDPQGNIVAKNLNGETLEKKLSEIITK